MFLSALVAALIAAGAMLATDVLGVIMVQAEATNRGWLAGWMDVFGWLFAIQTTSIAVGAIEGPALKHYTVLAFVSAANLFGTKLGQVIGKRLTGPNETTLGQVIRRVEKLEGDMTSKEPQ